MLALVPTGIKIGVSNSPWGVCNFPNLALPSFFNNSNFIISPI